MTEPITDEEYETVTDHSDLLDLLENLQQLVLCYVTSAKSSTKRQLLTIIAEEADVLVLKTQRMHQRWTVYLPFHEVHDVKFEKWTIEIGEWLKVLHAVKTQLTNGFLLDLVREAPVKELEGELKTAVPAECSRIDKNLRGNLQNWEAKVFPDATNRTEEELNEEWNSLVEKAANQLAKLQNELNEQEAFFSSELKEDQFKILALRLRHRDCMEAVKDANKEVAKAHNSWPSRFVKKRAGIMKEELKLLLIQDEKLKELPDYIDLDDPELYEDACFGQFLFKKRHDLTTEDVQQLVKKLEMINLLNEKYIDPNGKVLKREKVAAGRDLTEEENKIVKQLVPMTGKVEWRAGATADSMALGLKRMLGVGYTLDAAMQPLSDHLWKLLKSRKNCDAEKSMMVTWLNIVGWCVRQGRLSGGSPYLCKTFFPKCGMDDYKAIDKGRNEPANTFRKIEPLLERFLK